MPNDIDRLRELAVCPTTGKAITERLQLLDKIAQERQELVGLVEEVISASIEESYRTFRQRIKPEGEK